MNNEIPEVPKKNSKLKGAARQAENEARRAAYVELLEKQREENIKKARAEKERREREEREAVENQESP